MEGSSWVTLTPHEPLYGSSKAIAYRVNLPSLLPCQTFIKGKSTVFQTYLNTVVLIIMKAFLICFIALIERLGI